jgi:hypothetical protein
MENRTKNLIDRLLELTSKEQIDEEILFSHEEISESLKDRGFKINEDSYQDIASDQSITSQHDFSDFKFYNEVNFIKNGLEHGWSTYINDRENYQNI